MSGPPKISPTDVARYFALLQPPLIANRLFEDTSFGQNLGWIRAKPFRLAADQRFSRRRSMTAFEKCLPNRGRNFSRR